MQRWEYCHIQREFTYDSGRYPSAGYFHTGLLYYKTGQVVSIEENDPASMGKVIAKLGNEGWELVTITSHSNAHGFATTYYFKHPL